MKNLIWVLKAFIPNLDFFKSIGNMLEFGVYSALLVIIIILFADWCDPTVLKETLKLIGD